MITSAMHVDVARPLPEVWDFFMDLESYNLWQSDILSRAATDGLNTGSTVTVKSIALGRVYESVVDIIENDGCSYYRAVTRPGGAFHIDAFVKLTALSKRRTRVEFSSTIRTNVVFRLAEPVLQAMNDSKSEADMARLKVVLESGI